MEVVKLNGDLVTSLIVDETRGEKCLVVVTVTSESTDAILGFIDGLREAGGVKLRKPD
jgi:hypothetical protein